MAFLVAFVSCTPPMLMNRRPNELASVEKVGVLLFEQSSEKGSRRDAEVITEIFSMQMRRYFPELVERFEIDAALAARGEKAPTHLTPEEARRLGEIFDCDAFFVGRITMLANRAALIGLRGNHQFGLSVTLVSARTGETLIAADVDMEGSYLAPQDTPEEIAIYSVRKMVEQFGFEEKHVEWLSRRSPLWRAALEAYEERRFWDAACLFGEVVTEYPANILTEEAYLLLGRCFREVGLDADAERAWSTLAAAFPQSEFQPAALGENSALAFSTGRAREGDSLLVALQSRKNHPDEVASVARAIANAAYAGGLAARRAGDCARAPSYFALVPVESEYGPYAGYAAAECLASSGDERGALDMMRVVAGAHPRSRSHAALATEAWIAIGRAALVRGDDDIARSAFARARGRAGDAGRAALGAAWIHARAGDHSGVRAELANATPADEIDRLEATVLMAMAHHGSGDGAAAQSALEAAQREAAKLRGDRASGDALAQIAAIHRELTEYESPAWREVMRAPSGDRDTQCERIGERVTTLAADRWRLRERLALEDRFEANASRVALVEERCELLLAHLLLEEGAVARRAPSASTEAPATATTGGN
ncbi:MAG: hypothetical protein ACKVU1_01660 [bacterium]